MSDENPNHPRCTTCGRPLYRIQRIDVDLPNALGPTWSMPLAPDAGPFAVACREGHVAMSSMDPRRFY